MIAESARRLRSQTTTQAQLEIEREKERDQLASSLEHEREGRRSDRILT